MTTRRFEQRTPLFPVAFAAVLALVGSPGSALGQEEGPVPLSAAAMGLTSREAIEIERQYDALANGTRQRVRCAGTRGNCRSRIESLRVFRTVPAAARFQGTAGVQRFLRDKDWSHIVPRSRGGSDSASNGRWESRQLNRARGARRMTPAEVESAERIMRSAGFRERVRTAGSRMARGGALGAAVGAAIVIIDNTLEYQRGGITQDELLARISTEITRDVIAAGLAGAAIATVTVQYPMLGPMLGPVILFVGNELWENYGISIWNNQVDGIRGWIDRLRDSGFLPSELPSWQAAADRATRWSSMLTGAMGFGRGRVPIIAWTAIRPEAVESYTPKVLKTSTSRTLYAPPIADPDELRDWIRAQLRGRDPRSASGSPGPARPGAAPMQSPAATPRPGRSHRPRRRGRCLTASRGGRCPPRDPAHGSGSPTRR